MTRLPQGARRGPSTGRAGTALVDRRERDGSDTAAEPLVASWDPLAERAHSRVAPRRHPRGLRGMVAIYGWRVYALPVLVVLTVLVVVDAARSPASGGQSGATEWVAGTGTAVDGSTDSPVAPLIPNPTPGPALEAAKAAAELPGGGPFTIAGTGRWNVVPGSGPQIGTGRLFTYTLEVEQGVQLVGGPQGFATTVDATLNNAKSWIGSGHYAFRRINAGEPDLRISLTSRETTRALCGFAIPFDASCWKGELRRAIINTARWARGAVAFEGNVVEYQQYVVNHEVGHGLGFEHTPCPESGQLAPVMMQQTWGVSNDYLAALGTDRVAADGKVCEVNAWPYPVVP